MELLFSGLALQNFGLDLIRESFLMDSVSVLVDNNDVQHCFFDVRLIIFF